jgi:ribosomal protein S12 methylthiotransferase accessory factor
MELVERDAVALWWYNRLRVPVVDLASFAEPDFERMIQELAARGRELWVLELPTDLGVACHAAVSRRVDQVGEEIIFGFGSHFDAKISITRALTELHQFLPHIHPGNHPPTTLVGRFVREATLEGDPQR